MKQCFKATAGWGMGNTFNQAFYSCSRENENIFLYSVPQIFVLSKSCIPRVKKSWQSRCATWASQMGRSFQKEKEGKSHRTCEQHPVAQRGERRTGCFIPSHCDQIEKSVAVLTMIHASISDQQMKNWAKAKIIEEENINTVLYILNYDKA
jgi:hypothetical protein